MQVCINIPEEINKNITGFTINSKEKGGKEDFVKNLDDINNNLLYNETHLNKREKLNYDCVCNIKTILKLIL